MKKLTSFITSKALSLLALTALVVGTTSVSTTSMWLTQQVKCPEELLK